MMKQKEGNRIGKREKLGSNVVSTEAPGSAMGNSEDEINLRAVPSWVGRSGITPLLISPWKEIASGKGQKTE